MKSVGVSLSRGHKGTPATRQVVRILCTIPTGWSLFLVPITSTKMSRVFETETLRSPFRRNILVFIFPNDFIIVDVTSGR